MKRGALILAFTGSEVTTRRLMKVLETVGIHSFLKNENEAARVSGFGSTGKCEVFILKREIEKARPIIEEFSERNP